IETCDSFLEIPLENYGKHRAAIAGTLAHFFPRLSWNPPSSLVASRTALRTELSEVFQKIASATLLDDHPHILSEPPELLAATLTDTLATLEPTQKTVFLLDHCETLGRVQQRLAGMLKRGAPFITRYSARPFTFPSGLAALDDDFEFI